MNRIKIIVAAVLVAISTSATAQFSQLEKKSEFMLKAELSYGPYVGNVGAAGEHGFYLDKYYNMAGVNLMLGANVSQDWFIGGGVGYSYYHNFNQNLAEPLMGANVFLDVDFRPIWEGLMGIDYQPATIKWAPMIGGRVGGSLLLGEEEPAGYGSTITPLLEFYGGLNWYYLHGLRDMKHNWHSFYVTLGFAYMQQSVFMPVRLGWRW